MTTMTNKSTRILAASVALCLISMLALLLMPEPVAAQQAEVTPLMSKDLPELPGKEVTMITVVYHPGGSDPIHRHNAHAFV